jgi:hypothetical protein
VFALIPYNTFSFAVCNKQEFRSLLVVDVVFGRKVAVFLKRLFSEEKDEDIQYGFLNINC